MAPKPLHEVAIVGAGPIGLELAAALKRRDVDYVQLDKGAVGQTMFWWPPRTQWFSSNDRIAIAGVPLLTVGQQKATREEYLAYLRTVARSLQLSVRTHEEVLDIQRENGAFRIQTRSLFRRLGVELQGQQEVPAFDENTMQTNVSGVYVAGTATAGTQNRYRIFLENCHVHVPRIVAHLQGESPPATPPPNQLPET